MTSPETVTRVRVWDIYIRLFHWLLAGLVMVSFLSVQFDAMQIHTTSGICIVVLLIFRFIWGLAGSTTARFSHFVRGPKTILAYLRPSRLDLQAGATSPTATAGMMYPGHTPLGALSVIGMLSVLLIQVGSGMFADDDIYTTGPLARFVSIEVSETATVIHGINAKIVIALIILHLCAIAFYFFIRKCNLLTPMLTGDKIYSSDQIDACRDLRMGSAVAALTALALALAVGVWLYSL